MRPEINNR